VNRLDPEQPLADQASVAQYTLPILSFDQPTSRHRTRLSDPQSVKFSAFSWVPRVHHASIIPPRAETSERQRGEYGSSNKSQYRPVLTHLPSTLLSLQPSRSPRYGAVPRRPTAAAHVSARLASAIPTAPAWHARPVQLSRNNRLICIPSSHRRPATWSGLLSLSLRTCWTQTQFWEGYLILIVW
jgi:hypothetical protein